MPEINVPISAKGFSDLLKRITPLTSEITAKNRLFVERLATIGIPIINAKISESEGDSEKGHSTYISVTNEGDGVSTATLYVQNRDILFIEFGAGIHYNNSKKKNEKASELGYGVGSYPNQKHAFDEHGWYYEDHGVKVHSYGTEATMPMQSASEEIISQIRRIAREVFSGE